MKPFQDSVTTNRVGWIPFVGFYCFIGVALAISCSRSGSKIASESTADRVEFVEVGGRKLQLLSRGSGGPVVVIEAGMGEPGVESGSWRTVLNEISKTHRICIYDRAGLGKSDPATKLPRTSRDIAEDLFGLLTKAKVPGPWVLVGHSFGGMHVRMFASQYPEKVLGVVLVDSTHPDQDERWLASLPKPTGGEPETIKRARQFLSERNRPDSNPEKIDPLASTAQVRSSRGLVDKPLVILSHASRFRMDPQLPENVSIRLEEVSSQLQTDLKGLSSRSVHRQSPQGGHNLHVEDPELVIRGIREVLEMIPGKR